MTYSNMRSRQKDQMCTNNSSSRNRMRTIMNIRVSSKRIMKQFFKGAEAVTARAIGENKRNNETGVSMVPYRGKEV